MKNIFYVFLGVFIFSCDEYDPNSGTPKSDIHDVSILDGSTLFTNSLTLSWEGNEFASDFSYRLEPLDYAKIVGIDTAWSEWSIDTSVTLTYLDEGSYNFYVKSRFKPEFSCRRSSQGSVSSIKNLADQWLHIGQIIK